MKINGHTVSHFYDMDMIESFTPAANMNNVWDTQYINLLSDLSSVSLWQPCEQVAETLRNLSTGRVAWDTITATFPKFETQEAKS